MAATIKWADIEAEAENSGFRERLVGVFRKYEGLPTDERDGSNRVVKVTIKSFAEHLGIAPRTFDRWVKVVANTATTSGDKQASNRRFVRSIASQDPEAAATAALANPAATKAAKTAIQDKEQKEKDDRLSKHGVSKEQREAKVRETKKAKDSAKDAAAEWDSQPPTYRGKALLQQKVAALFGAAQELRDFLRNADPNDANWREAATIGGALDLIDEVHEIEEEAVSLMRGALDTSGALTVDDIVGGRSA